MNNKIISKRTFDRRNLPVPINYYQAYFPNLIVRPRSRSEWINVTCCFHDDSNPSLSINLISGGFYCFGCGAKGGDVIAFHMQHYNMPFCAAVTDFGAWTYE